MSVCGWMNKSEQIVFGEKVGMKILDPTDSSSFMLSSQNACKFKNNLIPTIYHTLNIMSQQDKLDLLQVLLHNNKKTKKYAKYFTSKAVKFTIFYII